MHTYSLRPRGGGGLNILKFLNKRKLVTVCVKLTKHIMMLQHRLNLALPLMYIPRCRTCPHLNIWYQRGYHPRTSRYGRRLGGHQLLWSPTLHIGKRDTII